MPDDSLVPSPDQEMSPMRIAGQIANQYAGVVAFDDYHARRADDTLKRQRRDLGVYAEYLASISPELERDAGQLQSDPNSWKDTTFGLVEGFKIWMLRKGYAVTSVNVRLSTIKTYARLAHKAGVIPTSEYIQIKGVEGYSRTEGKLVDEKRETTRVGNKKSRPVPLRPDQAAILKHRHPDTLLGKRDAVLMALLLDHGLRAGEVAILKVGDIDLQQGLMIFYRPKVDKVQTHRLTYDTLDALNAWLPFAAPGGPLLRPGHKSGQLRYPEDLSKPLTAWAISMRVRTLGSELIGVKGLSAHDCRHYWATHAAKSGTDPFALQEAGGWSSLAMPRRYVEDARIANEGVKGFKK